MKTIIGIFITFAAVVAVVLYMNNMDDENGVPQNGNGNGQGEHELIRVTTPTPNTQVASPLTVTGEARGQWYFEADFPVRLFDGNGTEIALGIATAQGDWMTTEFVPFTATLSFPPPSTVTGTLVFEKDNPSGLPENADQWVVPVRFGQSATPDPNTRTVSLFYYNEDRDMDANGNIRCSADGLQAVSRNIPVTMTPIQDTVRLLLRGELTTQERAQGISTEFPLAGLELTSASVSNNVLTLNFNDPQGRTSGGSCRVSILAAQIQTTARQFGQYTEVRLRPEELFQP
ncbi:MAG: Gmad2 immunoglobulin-like domain-containing protein [Parcubacteria group bacterium]